MQISMYKKNLWYSQKTTIHCNSDKKCLGVYGTMWYRVSFSVCCVTWKRHGTENCFSWVLLCLEFQQKEKGERRKINGILGLCSNF